MGLNNFDAWGELDWEDFYGPLDPFYDEYSEDEEVAELCCRCAERPWTVLVDDSDPSVGYRGEGYLCDVCWREVRKR